MAKAKISAEDILSSIWTIRGQRVILAADLARLFGVETKRLNEQVRRNRERSPRDFMFQLSAMEKVEAQRSQFATIKNGSRHRYLPYAFPEHGTIMAANVLTARRRWR